MIETIITWARSLFMYVIADATDNSITFSKRLFKSLNVMKLDVAKVYTFYIPDVKCYGFILNPNFEQETQLADVQYNQKKHCVGYECLVPTVNRILYDYGLQANNRYKLSVKACKMPNGTRYYQICRPYGNNTRKHSQTRHNFLQKWSHRLNISHSQDSRS